MGAAVVSLPAVKHTPELPAGICHPELVVVEFMNVSVKRFVPPVAPAGTAATPTARPPATNEKGTSKRSG
jgi:hypothetical protein